MFSPLKTFLPNHEGRDFVIGDLHGCYSLFGQLLAFLKFDPQKDRMFSVGDLVDRGPDSLKCLELLYEPWFHTVLSNHEQMMLEAFRGGFLGQFWFKNGGFWGAEALNDWRNQNTPSKRPPSDDSAKVFDLVEKLAQLPYLITVGLKNGEKVHIIHAELPGGQKITDEDLASHEKLYELATTQSEDGDFILWGRDLFYQFCLNDLSNVDKVKRTATYKLGREYGHANIFSGKLSHIISGHTIVQRPLTLLGQTNIDTGAFYTASEKHPKWSALTCLDLNEWKFYQSRPNGVTSVEELQVSSDDIRNLAPSVLPS